MFEDYSIFYNENSENLEYTINTLIRGKVLRAASVAGIEKFCCKGILGNDISLVYNINRYDLSFVYDPLEYHLFNFVIDGPSRVRRGQQDVELPPTYADYLIPEGVEMRVDRPMGGRTLVLRVKPAALRKRLSVMLGEEGADLKFDQSALNSGRFVEYVRQPLFVAARELGHLLPSLVPRYMAELEALAVSRILLHTRHTFSHRLEKPSPCTSNARIQQVEDFIHENWNENLTLEDLTSVAKVSGKTLGQDFVKKHGVSPSRYIRDLRLSKARAILLKTPERSVMCIALQCGFSSLGHFASAYRQKYGELPSVTAKAMRKIFGIT